MNLIKPSEMGTQPYEWGTKYMGDNAHREWLIRRLVSEIDARLRSFPASQQPPYIMRTRNYDYDTVRLALEQFKNVGWKTCMPADRYLTHFQITFNKV
jgi:hypothetical protein